MSLGKSILTASLIFATGSLILAADAPKTPATQPAPTTKPTKAKKLVEPWSMLKDLTPEQTAKIEKIHADALLQANKIKEKETDDINAILTPQQQTELKIDEAQKRLSASEKAAERRKEAATQMAK